MMKRETPRQARSKGYKVGYRAAMRDALEHFADLEFQVSGRPLEAFRKRMKRSFKVRVKAD